MSAKSSLAINTISGQQASNFSLYKNRIPFSSLFRLAQIQYLPCQRTLDKSM